jgi:hypothetical protein
MEDDHIHEGTSYIHEDGEMMEELVFSVSEDNPHVTFHLDIWEDGKPIKGGLRYFADGKEITDEIREGLVALTYQIAEEK